MRGKDAAMSKHSRYNSYSVSSAAHISMASGDAAAILLPVDEMRMQGPVIELAFYSAELEQHPADSLLRAALADNDLCHFALMLPNGGGSRCWSGYVTKYSYLLRRRGERKRTKIKIERSGVPVDTGP